MTSFIRLILIMVFLILGISSHGIGAQSETLESEPPPRVEDFLTPRDGKPSDKAKIFLVAGSSLVANFAQEIIDQKTIWKNRGITEEEISCYYVVPTQEEFEEELEQFRALAKDLKTCFAASVKKLREDLRYVARKKPPFLYLYLTSHGRQPISAKLKALKKEDPSYHQYLYLGRFTVLEQYFLDVEGLPDGSAGPYELLGAYRGGMDPEEIFLTPGYLTGFLQRNFPKTPKYLILQGCFSGGFLVDPRKEHWGHLLTQLENITVLTAASHNRESFGCDTGSRTTYYGGAFNEVLRRLGKTPPTTDWKAVHEVLNDAISQLEKKMGIKKTSNPTYFSNQSGVDKFL